MLAAESAGPAASQPAEDADLDREWRGVVLRGVRPLPGEVPGAGWGAPDLLRSRRHGHSWQRPYDDAGEELRPDRRSDGEMGPQVDRGVDRCGGVGEPENSSAFGASRSRGGTASRSSTKIALRFAVVGAIFGTLVCVWRRTVTMNSTRRSLI